MSSVTEVALIPEIENPAEIFVAGGLDPILASIEAKVQEMELDISTERGRREVASVARKIASSKTFIDDAGKELVASIKEKAKAIDNERKRAREFLDDLKDRTRAPLTEWEQRDQKRIDAHESAIVELGGLQQFDHDPTIEEIDRRQQQLSYFITRDWEEFSQRAKNVLRNVDHWLATKMERAVKAKAEAEELARLRKEAADREQRERDERVVREAAERATREAEAKAKADAEAIARKEAEARQAIELEKIAAEHRAKQAEYARLDAEAKAQAAAAKAELDRVAAEAKAKADAEAAVERERQRVEAERKAKEEEDARRQADEEHRRKIEDEIFAAMLKGFSMAGDDVKNLIRAISRGDIPHVSISY